eukprot:3752630-Pyramimonas_sp.AAC.1
MGLVGFVPQSGGQRSRRPRPAVGGRGSAVQGCALGLHSESCRGEFFAAGVHVDPARSWWLIPAKAAGCRPKGQCCEVIDGAPGQVGIFQPF